MDLGFWLLVLASANLFAGAVVTSVNELLFKELDFMTLPAWLAPVWSRPGLYVWMFTLFCLLLILAVNTILCTASYAAAAIRLGCLKKKLGIVLFHLAFVMALGGHCLSVFTVSSYRLIIETGTVTPAKGAGLTIETVEVRKVSPSPDNSSPPLGIEARLKALPFEGQAVELDIATMKPRLVSGCSLHLSFMDKGLSANQARLVVRRDHGIVLVCLAGLTACAAMVLYLIFSLPARQVSRKEPS